MAYKGEVPAQEAAPEAEVEQPASQEQEFEPAGQQDEEVARDPGEYVAPDPSKNPRNQALKEIAQAVHEQHTKDFAETAPSIDDEGNIQEPQAAPAAEEPKPAEAAPAPAAAPEPAKPAGIDPAGEYEVEVDGQKLKVSGQKIIDAGFRTYQKETAADYRLQLATKLLQDAEARSKAQPAAPASPTPTEMTDEQLAEAIQFGTPAQAAEALRKLGNKVNPNDVVAMAEQRARAAAADEVQFQDANAFVQKEYADLFANDYLKRLFFIEEKRRRAPAAQGGEGDTRPYKDLYKAIGDDLRKAFATQKPVAQPAPTPTPAPAPSPSVAARAAAKAATPPVPRTAAARLQAAEASAKAKTPSEVIAAMQASRGQNRLTQPPKGAH